MKEGSDSFKNYDLFGGAIKIKLPDSLIDARQIPDQQEVYISQFSNRSIIIEVLEKVTEGQSKNDPSTAIKFHFDSLAHDNSAQSKTIDKIHLPDHLEQFTELFTSETTPQPILLTGSQTVSKFNKPDSEADLVHISMALWRLNGIGSDSRGTDLILTINQPINHPDDSTQLLSQISNIFQIASQSLKIIDWGLFV